MQINLLWTGRAYYSLENCLVNLTDSGAKISSTIIGYYEAKIYKVEYRIETNAEWETVFLDIHCQHNNHIQTLQLQSDGKGNWTRDGQPAKAFNGCIDVDIPLTPLTNT